SPVEELSCGSRSTSLRVVPSESGKSLQPWTPAKKAAPHFDAAEKHFSARRLQEAAGEYAKGLALDPEYGPGWLYSGDVPFGLGDYEAALASYRKALALDPTLPQAHRFAGDALLKLGRLTEAEAEYVQALINDHSYRGAWQGLEILGDRMGFKVDRPEFSPPENVIGRRQGDKVRIGLDENSEWTGYFLCKSVWRHEDEYRRQRLGEKDGKEYSWTLAEERECLASYLETNLTYAAGKPEKMPPTARHLAEVTEAGLIDGYIVVAVIGQRCPMVVSMMPQDFLDQAEQYVRRFVTVR
ncbi:MAG TPA: tetratricopeptide repeat protein, partial [Thermoanaerobaculia bacterium]|nr:tetratricopeptide repeat protein [Thermoanaerobaculia bacterium]